MPHQKANEFLTRTVLSFSSRFVKASKPRDEIEAAIAAQMAAAHIAAMRYANRLAHAETLEEEDSAERIFNKLARTFAGLVETRQRYRAASDARALETVPVERDGVGAAAGLKRRRRARASADARGRPRTATRRSGAA